VAEEKMETRVDEARKELFAQAKKAGIHWSGHGHTTQWWVNKAVELKAELSVLASHAPSAPKGNLVNLAAKVISKRDAWWKRDRPPDSQERDDFLGAISDLTEAVLHAPAAPRLRAAILAMMEKRGWSVSWIHRSAYLHLEAAELAEAVRGKRGDTLDESADVLITMLALSPHNLEEIVEAAGKKVEVLMTKERYPGEQLATAPPAAAVPEGRTEKE